MRIAGRVGVELTEKTFPNVFVSADLSIRSCFLIAKYAGLARAYQRSPCSYCRLKGPGDLLSKEKKKRGLEMYNYVNCIENGKCIVRLNDPRLT